MTMPMTELWPAAGELLTASRGADVIAGWITACLAGEESGFVALYDHFAPMTFRLAYSLLQNREDAEEVLQDSFEYAFRRLSHFQPAKASFKTWLYQIVISRCRNKRRRRWLPTISLGLLADDGVADNAAAGPHELAALSERQRAVWAALAALSPKLRETAVLRYYEYLNYAEIGAILGIPAKTVESRMRLAHQALRRSLTGELYGNDE
jgi:RNA polymerase sigma-70 factor (ECF subfamily)